MKTKNIMVDGNRVLIKKDERFANWHCIATFHHCAELPMSPNSMAIKFANTLKEQANDK